MLKLSTILYDATGGKLTVGEKFSLSLTTLLLGMLVVFAVLLLIMIVILIVGKIFQSIDRKKAEKAAKEPAETPTIAEPAPVETAEDEGAIVAAITAAVSLCLNEEPGKFRVVSFRKTSAKPAWNKK